MKARSFCLLFFVIAASAMGEGRESKWRQETNLLALVHSNGILWQLNFKQGTAKPYFHPLNLADGTAITASQPPDHPWHYGLWFSWKYINEVNYWEEDKKTGLGEGRTELLSVKAEAKEDCSARVEMELCYHPPAQAAVMTEKRILNISAPDAKGNYSIDWTCTFTAGRENLKLDRTPPKNWSGGYGGLGLRLPESTRKWTFTTSEGDVGATNIYGKTARWIDFSNQGGVALFDNPQNPRHPTAWYPNQSMPWCTPALLFHEPYELAAGKTLVLRYRIFLHSEALGKADLDKEWKRYADSCGNLR